MKAMNKESTNTNTVITIIAEMPDYLIVNKPAGLMVHGDGRSSEITLADQILEQYPELDGIGEDWMRESNELAGVEKSMDEHGTREGLLIKRPGIVHRLDRDTSGLMIIARTQEFFDYIKQAFQEHEIHKVYRAYVYGWVKEDEGTIDVSIGKSRTDFRRWSAQRGARGLLRPAITDYQVLKCFKDTGGERFTAIEFKPKLVAPIKSAYMRNI